MPTATASESLMVSLETHQEFERRMDDNNAAISRRLDALEYNISALHDISTSVAELATSMKTMNVTQQEQREEMREIHTAVTQINISHIEATLEDHSARIRELEMKPQDSVEIENRLRTCENTMHCRESHVKQLEAFGERITALEQKPAKRWESMVGAVIAGIVSFLIGLAASGFGK